MYLLITYDVSTITPAGRTRLRRVAKTCQNHGQRVQNSVFECQLEPADIVLLKSKLNATIDPKTDSLRFYHLGNNWRRKVEHHGAKASYDVDGPMIV